MHSNFRLTLQTWRNRGRNGPFLPDLQHQHELNPVCIPVVQLADERWPDPVAGKDDCLLDRVRTNELFWDRFLVERQATDQIVEIAGEGSDEGLGKVFEKQANRLFRFLQQIRMGCERPEYPFNHARGKVSLVVHLLPQLPASGNSSEVISSALKAASGSGILVNRCVMLMAATATRVEKLAWFAPVPLPAALRENETAATEYVQ